MDRKDFIYCFILASGFYIIDYNMFFIIQVSLQVCYIGIYH